MKGQTLEVIKDLILSILIVASIGIILVIIFYNDIALTKVIPEVEEYALTKEMQNELNNSQFEEAQDVIINYYIDASDLKKYEKTNEYVKGKSNPFAQVSIPIIDNNPVGGSGNESSNTIDNSNSSTGFYEDDGTK